MLLVDLNYNFECDCIWFVELSDNKLFEQLGKQINGKLEFFKPITIAEIFLGFPLTIPVVILLSSSHLCKGTFVLNLTQTEGATVFPILLSSLFYLLLLMCCVFYLSAFVACVIRQLSLLYSWRFSRYSAPIHWLVHGHMTSNNETVSRQMP